MISNIQKEDIALFAEHFALKQQLKDAAFLITGATGLIGSTLIHGLLAADDSVRVVAPVRSMQKAMGMFDAQERERIAFIECDLMTVDYQALGPIDFVVHCAAPTSSRFFVEQPVETFLSIAEVSRRLLEDARQMGVKAFVYLSSLEVYGSIPDDHPITEDVQGYLDPMSVRSSYPMAKRAVENLCHLYAKEYGLNVMVARLTQTTGAGIALDDNRVIAQFTRLAAQGSDIILHTTGESARPYCYTTDSISAILYILLKGEAGEAYNVANEETFVSARGLAEFIRDHFNPKIKVEVQLRDDMGYAPPTMQRLDTTKLKALGWMPEYSLYDIIARLTAYLAP